MSAQLHRDVELALFRGGDYLNYADLVDQARVGAVQFWGNETAAVATEILTYPQRKVLHCFMAAGALGGIFELQSDIERFAWRHDCSRMIAHGRSAWGRIGAARGWRPVSMQFAKEIGP